MTLMLLLAFWLVRCNSRENWRSVYSSNPGGKETPWRSIVPTITPTRPNCPHFIPATNSPLFTPIPPISSGTTRLPTATPQPSFNPAKNPNSVPPPVPITETTNFPIPGGSSTTIPAPVTTSTNFPIPGGSSTTIPAPVTISTNFPIPAGSSPETKSPAISMTNTKSPNAFFPQQTAYPNSNSTSPTICEQMDINRIGDGWCDDPSINGNAGLINLNTQECGYDGGDCCFQSCNTQDSMYNCQSSGFHCIDPLFRNQSIFSNFTIEVIGTNFSQSITQQEVNAIFLVAFQYEETHSNEFPEITVISSVQSHFTQMMNKSVVIVDATISTYFNYSSKTRRLSIFSPNGTITNPTINAAVPGLERSVRTAAERAYVYSLQHIILCRNGIGLEKCLSRGDASDPRPLVQEKLFTNKIQCTKFTEQQWIEWYDTPGVYPGSAILVTIFCFCWATMGMFGTFHALKLIYFPDVAFDCEVRPPQKGNSERRSTNNITNSIENSSIADTKNSYRVMIIWFVSGLSTLRCLYFLWLLLWPTATSDEVDDNSPYRTQSYVACREFFFLNYFNNFSGAATASGAYQLLLGLNYTIVVFTVQAVVNYEWKYNARTISNIDTFSDRGIMHEWIQASFSLCMVINAMCVILVAITVGMLWSETTGDHNSPSAATAILLIIQSICGFLLCIGIAPVLWLMYFSTKIRSQNKATFYFQMGLNTVVVGALYMISAHTEIATRASSAFLLYTMLPRIAEIVLALMVLKRSSGHIDSERDENALRHATVRRQSLQPAPRHPHIRKVRDISEEKSQKHFQFQLLFCDRIADIEKNEYPGWVQSWRDPADYQPAHNTATKNKSKIEKMIAPDADRNTDIEDDVNQRMLQVESKSRSSIRRSGKQSNDHRPTSGRSSQNNLGI